MHSNSTADSNYICVSLMMMMMMKSVVDSTEKTDTCSQDYNSIHAHNTELTA